MPGLLPKNNRLDFNPNSIINASKKISAIQLEQMKNPVTDPDQRTLSTLEASKRLDDTFEKLQDLASNINSAVLRVVNTLATPTPRRRLGFGRMKGGADTPSSSASSVSTSPSLREYQERIRRDRERFRGFYDDDDRNSTATPSSNDYSIDFDAVSEIPDGSDFAPSPYRTPALALPRTETRSFPELMFVIIQLVRRMDILVMSRVRPVINKLSQPQIELLSNIYKMLENAKQDIRFPFSRSRQTTYPFARSREIDPLTGVRRRGIGEEGDERIEPAAIGVFGEYGDEIYEIFATEVDKLLLNLNVVINSWKQNTPMGQSSEDIPLEAIKETETEMEGSGRKRRGRPRKEMTLVGAGRNFYGEKISDSRDIPTIYSQMGVKNCPTKYLL